MSQIKCFIHCIKVLLVMGVVGLTFTIYAICVGAEASDKSGSIFCGGGSWFVVVDVMEEDIFALVTRK